MHKELFAKGLQEDDWKSDWTTLGTVKPGTSGTAQIIAKNSGIWAGDGFTRAALEFFKENGVRLECTSSIKNGGKFTDGSVINLWVGDVAGLLALERTYLNLVSYSSGIATATNRLVQKVKDICPKNPPQILHTRKILPAFRDVAIEAVLIGGGHAHRKNLSSAVLIKENHIAMLGSITKAVEGTRAKAPAGMKIEVEVRNFDELREAVELKPDVIMLDNFTSTDIAAAVRTVAGRSKIEISGGITENNIAEYAIEGVDFISIGSITHSVKSVDLSFLLMKP
jgi:nicotinate-nucleotide pyrophosphorylase (carboxylating)